MEITLPKPLAFTLGLVCILAFAAQGCAAGRASAPEETITGTIRLVGNEPFTHLVIMDEETGRAYLIQGPLEKELKNYQMKKLTLRGEGCQSPSPQFKYCFKPLETLKKF